MALTATVSFFFLKVIFYFVFLSIGAIKTAESDPLPVVVSCRTYLTKYIFNVASQTAKKAWSLKIDLQYIGYTALQQNWDVCKAVMSDHIFNGLLMAKDMYLLYTYIPYSSPS